jgi:glycerol kinase
MLMLPVSRPSDVETTARGAALLAAVGAGAYPNLPSAARAMLPEVNSFAPRPLGFQRTRRLEAWQRLIDLA